MVLLAAAIFSKDWKAILSRQFVEITRARIEALLTAFPKLVGAGKQHTFVETDSVRYVYQPLDKLYVLLLTTKASNILEDLETLRLFAKVIPEYSHSLDEFDIKENIFEIIFAFDEIVALGYRENVNLAQIRTFTEMDSHEEKVFLAVRETQEKEAIENMKKKVKEFQALRDNPKGNNYRTGFSNTGFGNSSNSPRTLTTVDGEKSVTASKSIMTSKISSGKAMRLGGKTHVVDIFMDQLKAEGFSIEQCDERRQPRYLSGSLDSQCNEALVRESVHVKVEEKLKIEASHDSGLLNMEVLGILILKVANKDSNCIRLKVDIGDAVQLQTHPNVDKRLFQTSNILQSKSLEKAFPVNQDIGLLKWRYQTEEVDRIPLLINCWPTKTGSGCTVTVEYELQNTSLELRDVIVSIPLTAGAGTPTIKEVSGEFTVDARKSRLLWRQTLVDKDNTNGTLEFETKLGRVEDFFPLTVSFYSDQTMTGLKMVNVFDNVGNGVKFSSDTSFVVDKYEIV